MFRTLKNECLIGFKLTAESPVSIRSGENTELDPSLPDNQFIRSYHHGEHEVVIPGSSIKGVFRSRVEKLLDGCCNVFDKECFYKTKDIRNNIEEKYKTNCPACRLFGSLSLKSRIEFKDAFPIKDTVKLATRHNVGIDRVTGAAKRGALFEPEALEQGVFEVTIVMKNFFRWQLKAVLQVFEDINEGYVTFGGVTSRGFGRMAAGEVSIKIREYGKGEPGELYGQQEFTLEQLREKLKSIPLSKAEMEKVDFSHEYLL